jgi:dihydropteroate synthase
VNAATHWRIGPETELDLSTPQIMGILNLTPDSFSDGGQHDTIEAAAAHAERMVLDGAAIIDVGGESTRPGAERIDAAEQIRRVVPVIEAIRSRTDIPISIDTTLAEVARAAIDSGATIINDVSAGVEDQAMLPLASERRCGIVLMHRLCPPDEDSWSDQYSEDPQYGDDVVGSVLAWLFARAIVAMEVGISSASICLDPGLGFGKTVLQNWQLIAGSERLAAVNYPVLAASSRKSFVGAVTGIEQPEQRDEASVAVAAMQYAAGLRLFRVHNVSAHRHALAQLG